jgi:Tfp pilus assembly protein PilF
MSEHIVPVNEVGLMFQTANDNDPEYLAVQVLKDMARVFAKTAEIFERLGHHQWAEEANRQAMEIDEAIGETPWNKHLNQ